jgi:hypothetical protein
MTKVKILSSEYPDILERMINEFITTRNVLSIKFGTACANYSSLYSAMIIYEED